MARKRGRRSTQKPLDELIAEIRKARKEWDALPLEKRLKAWREKREPTHRDAPPSFFMWHGDA
jgi:hypothetical protein